MAVSLNIAQPANMTLEDAVGSQMNTQTGVRQNGLFDSIFAGFSDSGNQTRSAGAGEDADSKTEVKGGGDEKEVAGECLAALMRQLTMSFQSAEETRPAEITSAEGKSTGKEEFVQQVSDKSLTGMMTSAANRLGQAITDISAEGKSLFSGPQLEEIRRTVGELEQAASELADQGEPVLPKEGNQGKEGVSKKSLKRISEKLDELMSLMCAAANPVPGKGEPDPGKMDISGDFANGAKENENARQIISSMQSAIEQCKDLMTQKQTDQTLIESDPSDKKQLFASPDKAVGTEDSQAITKVGDGKLFSNKAPGNAKPGEHPVSLSMPVAGKDSNPEGTSPAENKPTFPNVEAVLGDSSSSGEFSKGNGEAIRNPAENGKGNMTSTNVNMGIRSFEVTVQSQEQFQNAVSELSRPVSHEQIMAQVSDKLAATPSGGDISRITLKLHPEDLGELKISMKMESQSLKVDIVTENRNVRDALMQNMDSLKETLSRQNISMERFNVLTGGGYGNGDNYREWRQTAQNDVPNPFRQHYGFAEEKSEKIAGYLDSADNSLIDLRL
jgi:flagellar hook-length control protein FliK